MTDKAASRLWNGLVDRNHYLGYKPLPGGTYVSPAIGLRHVATHWRRGHWRRQAFGPGRLLRKPIWVMPVRVGAKSAGDDDTGHLYLVS